MAEVERRVSACLRGQKKEGGQVSAAGAPPGRPARPPRPALLRSRPVSLRYLSRLLCAWYLWTGSGVCGRRDPSDLISPPGRFMPDGLALMTN